ncbi:MAG: AAA family ATPase, partial [Chloroflexota bacterium]
ALLNRRWRRLQKGAGSFVAVIGEAGLGKSTLIAELKKSHEVLPIQWLRGDALSYTRSIGYFPWRQIIRQSINVREVDTPAEVREKLRYKCECCAVPGGDIPFLEAMLAVEDEASLQVVTGVQGDALIQKMADAVRGYLCGIAMEGPLAIVFDDLHWADEASLNLLLSLSDLAATHPMFFICMLRPDKTIPSWVCIQKIQEKLQKRFDAVLLEPLQAEQTDVMLNHLLGVKDLPQQIRDLIVGKAEGNPFFVEEIIRSLIETKQIVRENSHWRAVGNDAKVSIPNTLQGVLSARIDRLPDAAKNTLQNAAVIGRLFDLRVLKRLTHLNGKFDSQIRYLTEASLIEPLHAEYTFRHVLIQEAAYESILIKNRTQLHKQIGEALEELHADRIDEFAPLLAYHFYTAGDERSLKYDLIAGEKSARLYANTEAATHFSRALEVAKRDGADADQVAHLFTQFGSVLELSSHFEQALETYIDMQSFGREKAIRSIEMKALMAKATIYSIFSELHDSKLSEQMLIEALEISRELGDRATQAKLNWNLMLTFLFSKRPDESLQHGEVALALAREAGDHEQLAFVLNDLCRLYTCRGEFEKAYTVIQEARELWRSLDNQVMLADSFGSEAEARFNAGEFDRSIECSQQGLEISKKTENLWGQSYDRMLMAFVLLAKGQIGDGIQLAEQSIQLADEAGLIAGSISMRSELAWTYAHCGAFEKGLDLIERASQVAEAKQPAWNTFPQASKIRMYLLQGDVRSAEQTAGSALFEPISIPYARYTIFLCMANIELAVSKGDNNLALSLIQDLLDEVSPLTRVDIPEVLCWKGAALLALGRVDEAHQTLTEACSIAETLGANPQLWPVLAMLAKVNVKLGNDKEAESNRAEGRKIVEQIAKSLREVGLAESFLNQPRVQKLMR